MTNTSKFIEQKPEKILFNVPKDNKVTFFPNKTQSYTRDRWKAVLKTLQKKFCEKVDTFALNVRENIRNIFSERNAQFVPPDSKKQFRPHRRSFYDKTWKIFPQCPKKIFKTILFSEKKTIFSEKVPLDAWKCFWQSRKVSRSMSKNMSKTFFFSKKKLFWWKNSSGHVQCSSDHPVKKLRQGAKKLALNVRKRPETI